MEVLAYDVVCIGAGGAGVTAAVTAAAAGARVLLIAKEPLGYGDTRIAMGVVASVGVDPSDNPDVFFDDLMAGGDYLNNPKLAWVMAEEARLCPAIAERMGGVFRRDAEGEVSRAAAMRAGGHRYARSFTAHAKGVGLGQALRAASARAQIDVREETITVRLLHEGGRIKGLLAWDLASGEALVVRAKAVVLATGGLGWLYYPHTDCVRASTGDGYALAYEAGADIVDMEQVQFLPFACTHPGSMVGIFLGEPAWAGPHGRLLDGQGREVLTGINRMTRAQVSRVIGLELQRGNGTPHGGLLLDLRPNLATEEGRVAWQGMKDGGLIDNTLQVYGKAAFDWEEPWDVAPTVHFHMGGPRIDEHGRTNVCGLFAAGEVAGGLHGGNRLGSVALAELFVFGRRAGAAAAEYALGSDLPALSADEARVGSEDIEALLGREGKHRPVTLTRRLQTLMWENLGVLRSEGTIQAALTGIRELAEQATDVRVPRQRLHNGDLLDALELRLMLRTAEMVAGSAIRRPESRGAHVRTDYPDLDQEWRANIVIRRAEREMVFAVEPAGQAIAGEGR